MRRRPGTVEEPTARVGPAGLARRGIRNGPRVGPARPALMVVPFGSARAVKGGKRLRAGRDTGKVSPTRHTGSYRATVHTMRRVAAHRAPVNPRARKRAATVAQI